LSFISLLVLLTLALAAILRSALRALLATLLSLSTCLLAVASGLAFASLLPSAPISAFTLQILPLLGLGVAVDNNLIILTAYSHSLLTSRLSRARAVLKDVSPSVISSNGAIALMFLALALLADMPLLLAIGLQYAAVFAFNTLLQLAYFLPLAAFVAPPPSPAPPTRAWRLAARAKAVLARAVDAAATKRRGVVAAATFGVIAALAVGGGLAVREVPVDMPLKDLFSFNPALQHYLTTFQSAPSAELLCGALDVSEGGVAMADALMVRLDDVALRESFCVKDYFYGNMREWWHFARGAKWEDGVRPQDFRHILTEFLSSAGGMDANNIDFNFGSLNYTNANVLPTFDDLK
jgi:hypothetical protein